MPALLWSVELPCPGPQTTLFFPLIAVRRAAVVHGSGGRRVLGALANV